jgi:hypothetical protein
MEKELISKIARYVELSEKFSKTERDIFTEEELRIIYSNSPCMGMSISGGEFNINSTIHHGITFMISGRELYVDEKGVVRAKDATKPLTRAQLLEAETVLKIKGRVELLSQYDEYVKLRTQLKSYTTGVTNLFKGDCNCGPNECCSNCPNK